MDIYDYNMATAAREMQIRQRVEQAHHNFNGKELLRLEIYRRAVQAKFYNEWGSIYAPLAPGSSR